MFSSSPTPPYHGYFHRELTVLQILQWIRITNSLLVRLINMKILALTKTDHGGPSFHFLKSLLVHILDSAGLLTIDFCLNYVQNEIFEYCTYKQAHYDQLLPGFKLK